MRHIFIINPIAGSGKAIQMFNSQFSSYMKNQNIDYDVYITTDVGDAKKAVENIYNQRKDKNDVLRFYACGGDGTLNGVINGVINKENVEVACIPAGSGNDFIRNFADASLFRDIRAQLYGKVRLVDVIAYRIDENPVCYGVNLINIGADCVATRYKQSVKTKLLKGSSAYVYGALRAFIELDSMALKIQLDDNDIFLEKITILAVGNGTTYGGGFRPTPKAKVDDGFLDVCIVKKINRKQFLNLIGPFKKGTHIEAKGSKDIINYTNAKSIKIASKNVIDVAVDGELLRFKSINMKIIPKSLPFVVPMNGIMGFLENPKK